MTTSDRPFEITEILGEGSFGTVCVARMQDDPLRRLVAIKILKGAYAKNQKILNRTRDEARLLSQLNHPNVVRVEQLIEVHGRPIVVMELVRGVSLSDLLAEHGREGLPAAFALEIIRQTCQALHHVYNASTDDQGHVLHVIHRDIKPSNILVTLHGEVKVVDFGIARGEFSDREAHTESVVMGSRPYMAPERLDGIADSPAVDVYSAGMSLFELLTGKTMALSINPLTHTQTMEEMLVHIQVDGFWPADLERLRHLVRDMCSYDRDSRPDAGSVAAIIGDIATRMSPDHQKDMEVFAKDFVEPLYESRHRTTVTDEDLDIEDREFIRSVLSTSSTGRSPADTFAPHYFMGMLSVLLLTMMAASATKLWHNRPSPTDTSQEVSVKLWFPSDAVVEIDGRLLQTPSRIHMSPGPAEMLVTFEHGEEFICHFDVTDGIAVRYVIDRQRASVSIDDGPSITCEPQTLGRTTPAP